MLSRRGWIGVLVLLHIKVTLSEAAFKGSILEVSFPTTVPAKDALIDLDYIFNQSVIIKRNLMKEINCSDIPGIFTLLRQFQTISSNNNLNEQKVLKVLEIFETFTDIVELLSHQLPEITKNVYAALLKISNFVLSSNNHKNWKKTGKMPAFLQTLEDMAVNIANITSKYSNYTGSIAVQSRTFQVRKQDEGYIFPEFSELPSNFRVEEGNFVYLPIKALSEPTGNLTIVAIFFLNIQDGLPESMQEADTRINPYESASLLASYSILHNGLKKQELQSPAYVHFKMDKKGYDPKCLFWDTSSKSWNDRGLSVQLSTSSKTVCKTTHFTSFAVFTQVTSTKRTEDELSLLIKYAGSGISVCALLVASINFFAMD